MGMGTAVSGIDAAKFISTPLTAVPIPIYQAIESGRRRWAGLNPELMVLPLMWLPQRLAYPYEIIDADEEGNEIRRLEDPEELALRIVMELSQAGLYNPQNAGWVDVLELHGLDSNDPATLARVSAWLEGEPDSVLDAIDLTEQIEDLQDRDWALHMTQGIFADMKAASWHVIATGLVQTLRGVREEGGGARELRDTLELVCTVAIQDIGDALLTLDLDLGTRLGVIQDLVPEVTDTELVHQVYPDTIEALTVVVQAYSQNLEMLMHPED